MFLLEKRKEMNSNVWSWRLQLQPNGFFLQSKNKRWGYQPHANATNKQQLKITLLGESPAPFRHYMIDVTQKQQNAGRGTVSSNRYNTGVFICQSKLKQRFLVITYQIEDNCSWCSIQNPSASCHSWGSNKSIQKKLHYKPPAGTSQSFDNQPETHLSHSTHLPILLLSTLISYKSLFLSPNLSPNLP